MTRKLEVVPDFTKSPKRLAGGQIQMPVRFILMCIHCLGEFPSPEPGRRCCEGCFSRKHNYKAEIFTQCPKCCNETSASICRRVDASMGKAE